LAFFGAPLVAADDCQRAVACAVEMQLALKTVNAEQRRLDLPELAMGIGINTGEVVVGNIGSEKRVAYGAVGSAINEAYRIESYTVGGQILISPSTYAKTRDLVEVGGVKEVQFKGLQQPVSLYAVTGIGGRYAVHLPAAEPEKLTKLKKPLSIDCFVLEGKSVSDVKLRAQITHVSQRAADVILDKPVRQDSNYRVLFFIPERTTPAEAYAKVIAVKNPDTSIAQKQVRLRFTWLSEEVKKFLEHL
jgi:adenylate cyclase